MKQPLIISLFVLLGLLGILAFLGSGDKWPAVEDPPRQGEAVDRHTLNLGRIEHSATAIGRLVREPQNTWSNLAFVFAGSCLASFTRLRASRLVGVALIAVGVGSFLYHASASRTFRHLDVGAMYGLFFAILALATAWFSSRLRACFETRIGLLSLAATVVAIVATFNRNTVVFGMKPLALSTVTAVTSSILIGVLISIAFKRRSIHAVLRAGLVIVLFLGAVICQVGDRPDGWLFNPESIVQAHSLWHILSATALFVAVWIIDVDLEPDKSPEPTQRTLNWGFGGLVGASEPVRHVLVKSSDHPFMSEAANPIMNRTLYAEAEKAAFALFVNPAEMDPERRGKAMEKAARAVFRKAGTPAEASALYACAITCDIFERERR